MANANSRLKTKKLIKFGVLVGIREGYLFLRNLYGLYMHPFLTTRRIMREKDWSQGVLIFGLPIYLWLGWVLVLLVSRIFIFQELRFGFLARASFLFSSLFLAVLMLFLGYWLMRVRERRWKKGRFPLFFGPIENIIYAWHAETGKLALLVPLWWRR